MPTSRQHARPAATDATRERFIEAATVAFADRGFYGVSIASIAETLGLTKQALLHHFGSKEKLYGEVLRKISDRLMAELDAIHQRTADAQERMEITFVEICRSSMRHSDDTQLLMRELLDNKRRAETARTWYLKPFLETLTAMVIEAAPSIAGVTATALVYQVLGAINYFAVSQATLGQMYGKRHYADLAKDYENELRALIRARMQYPHSAAC